MGELRRHPGSEENEKDIYGKCVPCIMNLYEQLKDGKTEVDLGLALKCWKVQSYLTAWKNA